MKSLHTLFFLVLSLNYGLSAQTSKDSLINELDAFMRKTKLPGIGISITDKDKSLYTGGHGFRDIGHKEPYTAETVQPIASISKTIIAMALMQLVERGKLDLNIDINDILPFNVHNPYYPKEKITILQLATHTSSINDTYQAENAGYFIIDKTVDVSSFPKEYAKDFKYYVKTEDVPYTTYLKSHLDAEGANFSKKIFGKYPPGQQYAYSNVAATLAAYIVELVSGQSFESFTQEFIFEPLGMKATTWKKNDNSDNQATLYFQNCALVPAYKNVFFPSSTLHTNSKDMGKYMIEMIKGYNGTGQLLNKASYDFMLSNKLTTIDAVEPRGIFWLVNKDNTYFSHDGSNIGIRAKVVFNRDLDIGIFLMTNMDTYEDDSLTAEFYGVLSIIGKYAKRL